MIFSLDRPIDFEINSTNVIGPVKQNKLSFSNFESSKPLPVPVYIGQIEVQKIILIIAYSYSCILRVTGQTWQNQVEVTIKINYNYH